MSTTGVRRDDTNGIASVKDVDLKLEVVVIPRLECRSREEFDGSLGWRLDGTSRSITA